MTASKLSAATSSSSIETKIRSTGRRSARILRKIGLGSTGVTRHPRSSKLAVVRPSPAPSSRIRPDPQLSSCFSKSCVAARPPGWRSPTPINPMSSWWASTTSPTQDLGRQSAIPSPLQVEPVQVSERGHGGDLLRRTRSVDVDPMNADVDRLEPLELAVSDHPAGKRDRAIRGHRGRQRKVLERPERAHVVLAERVCLLVPAGLDLGDRGEAQSFELFRRPAAVTKRAHVVTVSDGSV